MTMRDCKNRLGLCAALVISAVTVVAVPASAQTAWPSRPIRLVVPYSPGGSTDVIARILGKQLQDTLGSPVIVENRPGANSIIGANAVAKAPADGHTLLVSGDSTWVMNQYLYDKLPYSPLTEFEPVAKIAFGPMILIASPKGPNSFAELMAQARTNPDALTYSYGAITSQLAGELLKSALKADLRGVAYKGSAGVLQGLLSSDVDFGVDMIAGAKDYIRTGRLRLLANLGTTPIPGFPNVPVAAIETGYGSLANATYWIGITAPRGTPTAVIERLDQAIAVAIRSSEYLDALAAAGLISDYLPAAQFRQFMLDQAQLWGEVIPAAGIKIQ